MAIEWHLYLPNGRDKGLTFAQVIPDEATMRLIEAQLLRFGVGFMIVRREVARYQA